MTGVSFNLNSISHTYPGRGNAVAVDALDVVDIEIRSGEFYSVVGPSGCGKSTLLDILAGLVVPSGGTIDWNGTRPATGEIGVVFQEDASFPWLSVHDNIAFPLRIAKLSHSEREERVAEVIQLVGLSDFADHLPSQLSGGMRQRVCIARALVTRPKVLLLDEPFAALDSQTRLLMGEELLEIWRRFNPTIVLITHSLDEAVMLSDRVGIMSARPGKFIEVLETGWPKDRDSRIAGTDAYGLLVARLWSVLRVQSMVAMGRSPDVPE